jgi:opacity protein-like surface antigen
MKKLLLTTLCALCASALVVSAQDAKPTKKAKHEMTAEQKAVMDEMVAKYDTNKDGKLDKTERSAMSKEDKAALAKAGLGAKKKAMDAAAPAAPAAPATDTKK